MRNDEPVRRDVLQGLAAMPLAALLAQTGQAAAQPPGSPVKVDAKGLAAKIKFEAPLAGFLTDLNGKYKLRVTELTLAPDGFVGEHNHVGPGIRQVTSGYMTYVLPEKTVVYGPGEFFFVSGFFESEYIEVMGRIWDKPRKPVAAIHCKIIICAAGSAAEEEICGGSRDAIGDDEQIAFLLALLPEGSRREQRLRRFARRLVKRHREAIINVAANLALASELHGRQIDALVRESRT